MRLDAVLRAQHKGALFGSIVMRLTAFACSCLILVTACGQEAEAPPASVEAPEPVAVPAADQLAGSSFRVGSSAATERLTDIPSRSGHSGPPS